MISSLFPKARPYLLLENGAYVNGAGDRVSWSPGTPLLISRALCQYRLFQPTSQLKPAQAASAARAWAEAHAPFEITGTLLLRTPSGAIGVWFWDAARTSEAAADRVALESLHRAGGDGWRIVACAEGFEAQRWSEGVLLASTWRRAPFTREQWLAFVLGTEAPQGDAPDDPPAPQVLPLLADTRWRRARIGPPLSWRDGEKLGGSVALVGCCVTAFFVGQALRSASVTSADAHAAAAIAARVARDHDAQRTREFESVLGDYNGVTQETDVLAAATDAFQVYTQFGLQVTSWRANAHEVHASIAGSLPQIPLHDVIEALEAKSSLCNVTPIFPRSQEGIEITAHVAAPGVRCVAGNTREAGP